MLSTATNELKTQNSKLKTRSALPLLTKPGRYCMMSYYVPARRDFREDRVPPPAIVELDRSLSEESTRPFDGPLLRRIKIHRDRLAYSDHRSQPQRRRHRHLPGNGGKNQRPGGLGDPR